VYSVGPLTVGTCVHEKCEVALSYAAVTTLGAGPTSALTVMVVKPPTPDPITAVLVDVAKERLTEVVLFALTEVPVRYGVELR
jgi:hypothetical protein